MNVIWIPETNNLTSWVYLSRIILPRSTSFLYPLICIHFERLPLSTAVESECKYLYAIPFNCISIDGDDDDGVYVDVNNDFLPHRLNAFDNVYYAGLGSITTYEWKGAQTWLPFRHVVMWLIVPGSL